MSTDSNRDDGRRAAGLEAVRVASAAPNIEALPVESVAPHTLILDASGASQLTIPGGTFLVSADYVREGDDLLLIGADGHQVLIRDFFASDVPPDLISDTGLRISGDLAERLAGPETPGQFAQAQTGAAAQPIGRVETLEGWVTAARVDGTQATLEVGSPIFEGDVLQTGDSSTVGVIFVDDSTFALDENGRMVIDELVFDPGTSEGSSAFSVVQGAFTFVSGQIAGSGPDNMVVTTPVATIGVRGTVAGGVAGPEGTLNTVTLLSDGEISVTNATGTTTLNLGAGQTLQVLSFFTDPGQPIILTTAEINNLLGGAIGAAPPSPGGESAAVPDAAATAATQAAQRAANDAAAQEGDGDGEGEGEGEGEGTGEGEGEGEGEGDGAAADGEGQAADGDGATGDGPPADAGPPGDLVGGDEGGGGSDILLGGTGDGGGDLLNLGSSNGPTDSGPPPEVPPPVVEVPDPPSISITGVTVNESAGVATFTLTRLSGSGDAIVSVSTSDGTATAGSDYVAFSGDVTLSASATTVTFDVTLLNDFVIEADETFSATITAQQNSSVSGGTATATISNDDSLLSMAVGTTGSENPGSATFNVARTGFLGNEVTVQYSTSDLTTTAGSDYTAASNVLVTFGVGVSSQTITVPVLADTLFEGTERFTVSLGTVTGEVTVASGSASAEGRIINDFTVANGQVPLSLLSAAEGYTFNGILASDQSGSAVAAGDVNGDGIPDIIIGAPRAEFNSINDSGQAYVVFGGAANLATLDAADGTVNGSIDLCQLGSGTGFVLNGGVSGQSNDYAGADVAIIGDVNGDGIGDVLIGAPNAGSGNQGEAYVVFGNSTGGSVNLSDLNGTNGLKFVGIDSYGGAGASVSLAGDVNGDGINDFVIGARYSDVEAGNEGRTFVVFGGSANLSALDALDTPTGAVFLSSLNGTNGFTINGEAENDQSGLSVERLGDVNGDGVDDLIIGAPRHNANSNYNSGAAYVVFGKPSGQSFAATLNLSALDGTNGFSIDSASSNDRAGYSVSSAGDVNGDGVNDILIGARYADSAGQGSRGAAYVVFGKPSGQSFGAEVDLSALNGTNGFRLDGSENYAQAGRSVSGAGDINGDGFDDLIVGAERGNETGSAFVVFGGSAIGGGGSLDLTSLNGANGFRAYDLDDNARIGNALSAGGDINGDGVADFLVGAYRADVNPNDVGKTFLVFGNTNVGNNPLAILPLNQLDGNIGFQLDGVTASDGSGTTVRLLGDVNGDGFADALIGAPGYSASDIGTANLVLGSASGFVNGTLAGKVRFDGESSSDNVGENGTLGGAGDINGDGIADFIIGVPDHSSSTGAAYVVFGSTNFPSTTTLDSVGFELLGSGTGGFDAGQSVDAGGDVNGDGLADIIVGSPDGGYATVVFGATSFAQSTSLTALDDGTSGFRLSGSGDDAGHSVVIAGDINGDGFDDLIVGARYADVGGSNTGSSFVVFGQSSFPSSITLTNLDGTTGFRLDGIAAGEISGDRVAGGGDFNGDGFDDLVIGARGADINGNYSVGSAYVVFGKASGFNSASTLNSSFLDGTNGFTVNGVINNEQLGGSISLVGDLNGDGYDDLIVGGGYNGEGLTAVIFGGSAVGSSGTVEITALNGANGFVIPQRDHRDYAGSDVSTAGDINGDGFDDLIIGARRGDASTNTNYDDRGETYFIFGGDFSNAVNFLGTTGADALSGGTAAEVFVGGLGDDVIVGGGGADVLKGGSGNDVLSVGDLNFRRVEGDAGTDTLQFSLAGSTIDLTGIANNKISGIEKLDITGTGNNTLNLALQDILTISDTSNTLFVSGNTGDAVTGTSERRDGDSERRHRRYHLHAVLAGPGDAISRRRRDAKHHDNGVKVQAPPQDEIAHSENQVLSRIAKQGHHGAKSWRSCP